MAFKIPESSVLWTFKKMNIKEVITIEADLKLWLAGRGSPGELFNNADPPGGAAREADQEVWVGRGHVCFNKLSKLLTLSRWPRTNFKKQRFQCHEQLAHLLT